MTKGVMNRRRWMEIGLLLVVLSAPLLGQPADNDRSAVKAAMLRWRIGIERAEPASEMVETIAPVTMEGRLAWRITHYPFEPDEGGFDVYDVDAATFSPIRSVMKNPAFELSLAFDSRRVLLRRTEKGHTVSESIALDEEVRPEGPGHRVFIAGLPLKPGYTLTFRIVDRWSGKERSRVKDMRLSVSDRRRVQTALGSQEILDVITAAVDGSVRIVEQVRAEPPHYPFRLEYTRGKTPLVSDVTTMAIDSLRPDPRP
jgi:hypothetical protein